MANNVVASLSDKEQEFFKLYQLMLNEQKKLEQCELAIKRSLSIIDDEKKKLAKFNEKKQKIEASISKVLNEFDKFNENTNALKVSHAPKILNTTKPLNVSYTPKTFKIPHASNDLKTLKALHASNGSKSLNLSKALKDLKVSDDDKCVICQENDGSKLMLDCGHKDVCVKCVDEWRKTEMTIKCPTCQAIHGNIVGNQPHGGIMTHQFHKYALPGYPIVGTIEIKYCIPNGIQNSSHPNPGTPYTGTCRKCYLPDNQEGNEILEKLYIAFHKRLTFTIGKSVTSGIDNTVVWNDIHHKTSTKEGPYGYPDPTYLARVIEELKAKGIK